RSHSGAHPRRSRQFEHGSTALLLPAVVRAVPVRAGRRGRDLRLRDRLRGCPHVRAHLEPGSSSMSAALGPSKFHRRITLPVLGVAGVAIYLFPIYWMLISGFKTSSEIFASPPTFFPERPTLDAFWVVFQRENVLRYITNSLLIALPVVGLTLLLGSMGA